MKHLNRLIDELKESDGDVDDATEGGAFTWRGGVSAGYLPLTHLFDYDLATNVNGVVVDHIHDSDSEVTADAEWDAEAEAAHDGDDVPARETEARAVAQRRFLLRYMCGPPVFRQLDNLTRFLLFFHHPLKIPDPFCNVHRVMIIKS